MNIGAKIKNLRTLNGLTQEELADRCELTKGFISQLENNNNEPSISTLQDILTALGTNLSDFFAEVEEEQVVFSKDDFFTSNYDNYSVTWLVPNSQKNEMEPILLTLHPHKNSHEMTSHHGEEFGYVLKGSVTLVRGNKRYKLKSNETFYLDGTKGHYLYNHSNSDAKVLWITTPPMF